MEPGQGSGVLQEKGIYCQPIADFVAWPTEGKKMLIGGLQKTTLLDFPGRVACTVFTVGCNFACPFCHNRELVTKELFEESGRKMIDEKELWSFLEKRKGILDGVCITGGEPTLQPDLEEFCQKIKKMGLKVKLDTNGSSPEILEELLEKKLLDFVAVDIKASFDEYVVGAGLVPARRKWATTRVARTAKMIIDSGVEYELRTTVVPRIHAEEVLINMSNWIRRLDHWVWQNFRAKNCLNRAWEREKSYSKREIIKLRNKISREIKLRGW